MLFDNGDLIQGSPLGDWAAEAIGAGRIITHPMIEAMNAIGFDAASLGNHEFNYGLEVLDAALAGAEFPFVCCNVLKPDGAPYFRPWTLLSKTVRDSDGAILDLKIGVVGFVTPQITRWDMSYLAGRATTIGVVEAARIHVPACRAAGADVIVALCHAGVSRSGPAGADENAGLALAESGGLDAIFVGHQHLLLPGADFAGVAGVDAARGALAGVPAVMAGFWGGHVGIIDLTLANAGASWRVTAAKAELRSVAPATSADATTLAATSAAHAATLAYVRAPVGALAQPLASYFAMIGDDASVRIVHDAQLWYARLMAANGADSAPRRCSPPRRRSNAAGATASTITPTPAGEIALRHVADLYVYPNGLRIVQATGAIVREWLERSASVLERLDVNQTEPQPLLKPDFAAYDFDSIAGVSYRIDLTQAARYDDQGRVVAPDARRVVDLCFEGRPIVEDAIFHVVTNSYRAGGGGHFPGCDGGAIICEAPDTNFDALRNM